MISHLTLIGINFHYRHSTGDKNFWVDILPFFSDAIRKVSIISIRREAADKEEKIIKGCQIVTYYIPPFFLETPDVSSCSGRKLFWRKGAYPARLAIIEKYLSSRRICSMIESINHESRIDHVHLIDNFGFANGAIVKKASELGSTVSISVMTYMGKKSIFYNSYHKFSINKPNLYVIPYSETHRRKLISMGIPNKKLKRIPWGVPSEKKMGVRPDKDKLKVDLGFIAKIPVYLWAGYIQQINEEDFSYAYKIAKTAIARGLNAQFVFAFKPESADRKIKEMSNAKMKVKITTKRDFDLLKQVTDIFYSPINNANSIAAPPLTWIEMMAKGIPIITTNVPGVDEMIDDSISGFVAKGDEDMVDKLFLIGECYMKMSKSCMQKIEESYNVKSIAEEYLNFWNSLKGKNNGI